MQLEQVGKYKILGQIGQGAMGEVWKAHDPVLARYVAIKTMSAGVGADETLRKRFHREAQAAAHLNHPNIITVYDFGEEHGQIYIAMELLEGTDLREIVRDHTLSEVHDKLDIIEQICDGLAYAHSKDVVHRDLKPGNIHVLPGGQVKIMDFGLARLGSSDMTKTGMILGTPNYMSPEQVRGEKADARSDIFSLGAVFYEVLTNHKPFDADSLHAVLFNVLQQEPEPVRKWAPEVPQPLVQVVEKALSKDPAERFQNAGELREALRVARKSLAEGWVGEPTVAEANAALLGETLARDASTAKAAPRPAPAVSALGVDGTGALDPEAQAALKSGSRIRPPGATLSGRVPTQVPVAEAPVVSRAALYFGGALGLAALGVTGYLLLRPAPKPAEPAAGVPAAQVGALTQALVGSQVELARRSFQDKDYRGAIAQAEQALKLDSGNAQAREVAEKAKASLAELDATAAEARSALEAGDADRASKALERVLALDPKHPVVAELSQQLGSRFRGQAEEARRLMARSRSVAEKGRAGGTEAFTEGASLGHEADLLFQKGDFTGAAQRFLASRDAYDRARRAEEEATAARTPPPASAPPHATAAASTAPATLPPVATAPPAAATPPVLLPPSLAPVTAPPVVAPPVTAPATMAISDETVIRKVVADYGRAIETKDLALFRAIKPNLSLDEEHRLREAFEGIQSQQVSITVQSVQISGGQAKVRVSRHDTINGNPVSAFQQTLVLVKGPAGWTIREIGR